VAALPATITPTASNDLFSSAMVFPATGHVISCTATIYTFAADLGSGTLTPLISIYTQAAGTNGQSTGVFTASGIGNQVAAGLTEPSVQASTTTTVPSSGSVAVNLGDRYVFIFQNNDWGSVLAVSITAIMSVP